MKKAAISLITMFIICLWPALPLLGQNAKSWELRFVMQSDDENKTLAGPTGLFVSDASNKYYIADTLNNRLLSFDENGNFQNSFDAGGKLQLPVDLVRDHDDRLWVVEKERNSLTLIDLKQRQMVPKSINDNGRDVYPHKVEIADNTLYILDKLSGDVLSLDADLKVAVRFKCESSVGGFSDFKIRNGKIWALSSVDKTVSSFDGAGNVENRISLGNTVQFPVSLEVDKGGQLFILDRHAGTIAVFTADGRFQFDFLAPGRAPGQLYYPAELQFDPWGRLCVVQEGNGRVEVFSR